MTREGSIGGERNHQYNGDSNGYGGGRGGRNEGGFYQRGGRVGYQDNQGRGGGDGRPPFNRNRSFMSNNTNGNSNYMGG